MWNDAYRVLEASMELCSASMTSPSQTTEKLAGFWRVPTQQMKGDWLRWVFCSLMICKISSLGCLQKNTYIKKWRRNVYNTNVNTLMKQMTRSTISTLEMIQILCKLGTNFSNTTNSFRHSVINMYKVWNRKLFLPMNIIFFYYHLLFPE
jgi:hypothetical protein